jgi:Coenzyme PQQ synthesis protein D (PqqD)
VDNGILDEAYERLHHAGPEWGERRSAPGTAARGATRGRGAGHDRRATGSDAGGQRPGRGGGRRPQPVRPTTGSAALLNATAAAVWRLLDGRRTVDDIADHLAATYRADPDTVRRDVRRTVRNLTSTGVLA